MVKVRGIEPRTEVSKTPRLPLHYTKIYKKPLRWGLIVILLFV